MKKQDDVQEMFSSSRDAKLWEEMYPEKPVTFEQYMFGSRRDDAIDFVTTYHQKGHRILDLGCGTGPFASKIISQGYQCLATDYSLDILQIAREKLRRSKVKNSIFTQSDCQYMPFADASFDAVICLGVISYVPYRDQAVSEMMRILKPGGSLYLTFRNRSNPIVFDPANWLRALSRKRTVDVYAEEPGEFLPGSFLKPEYVLNIVRQAGFTVHFQKGIGRGPLRIRGKTPLPHGISIALDRVVVRFLDLFGMSSKLLGADIVIFACRKPASTSSQ